MRPKKTKHTLEGRSMRYLLTSLLALVALQQPALASELPRIIVYITVEDLRADYLEQLRPLFVSDGINRMITDGRYERHLAFPLVELNRASSVATLHTGAYPQIHGIERPTLWDSKLQQRRSIFHDSQVLGHYSRDTFSPKALQVNTLGDRLKEASGGASLVYAVAPSAEVAITSAGWFGNGAFWLDDKIGSWASSSYYEAMPKAIEAYNRSAEGPNKRLVAGQMLWTPQKSYSTPQRSWSDWSQRFSHRYQGFQAGEFKRSALANEEVTTLALRLLEAGGYTESKALGMLALGYSLDVRPRGTSSELTSEEVDAYVRLDQNIHNLLKVLEQKFGRNGYLVALTGTGYSHYQRPNFKGAEARYGQFSTKKASALLNLFLSALYGQGSWVEHLQDGRLILNKKLAESKRISLSELQQRSASFLEEMEGIGMAVTGERLITQSSLSDEALRLRRSVHNRYLADVYWTLIPGWTVEEHSDNPNLQLISTAIDSPCILFGAGVSAKEQAYPLVEAPDLVKAISRIFRIRPPNAVR